MSAAVMLFNPKYPHNVAQVIRACSCYDVPDLVYTGDRMDRALAATHASLAKSV